MVSDRELMVGVLLAIGALAEKLTGESLEVRLNLEEEEGLSKGSWVWGSFGSAETTRWSKPNSNSAEAVSPSVESQS